MTKIAKEYMELMGIKATQYLLVRLFDNGNPHCHLVYNRINNEGKTITYQNDYRRNEQVTKQLKRKYGLTFSKGKYKTKTERLRGCEKTKYEIHRLVMNTLAQATSWKDFNSHLKEEGVSMEIVMRTKDSRDMKDMQGIRFTKDGLTFKASQLKRGMTFAKMDAIIRRNAEKAQQAKAYNQSQSTQYELPKQKANPEPQKHAESSISIPSLSLFDTNNPVYDPAEEEFRRRMQKKKKKRSPKL